MTRAICLCSVEFVRWQGQVLVFLLLLALGVATVLDCAHKLLLVRAHLSKMRLRQYALHLFGLLFLCGFLGIDKHVLESLEYVKEEEERKREVLSHGVRNMEKRDVEDPLEQGCERYQLLQG